MLTIKLYALVKVNSWFVKKEIFNDNRAVNTIEKKISLLRERFSLLISAEQRYLFLINLGRHLPPYPDKVKNPLHRVSGCQSTLYLLSHQNEEGHLLFYADSEALISKGLAALLISIYSQELPETILKTPPLFLSELDIISSLTPSRSNGLAHIHKRIKEDALKTLSACKRFTDRAFS